MAVELEKRTIAPELTLRRVREGDAEFLVLTLADGCLTPGTIGGMPAVVRAAVDADPSAAPVLFDFRQRQYRGDPVQVERFFTCFLGILGTETPRGGIILPKQSPWRRRFLHASHPLFFPLFDSEAAAIGCFRKSGTPSVQEALETFRLLVAHEYQNEVREDPLHGFRERGLELSVELKSLQGLAQATGHVLTRVHPVDRADAPRVIVAGYVPSLPATGLEMLGLFEICLQAQLLQPGDFLLLTRRENFLLERLRGTSTYSNLPYPIRYLQVGFNEESALLSQARPDTVNIVTLPPFPGQAGLDRIRDLVYTPEFLAGQWAKAAPLLAAADVPAEAPSEYLRDRAYKMQEYARPILARAIERGRVFVLAPLDEAMFGMIQLQLRLAGIPFAAVLSKTLALRFRDVLQARTDRRRRSRETFVSVSQNLRRKEQALTDGVWPGERPLDRLRAQKDLTLSPRLEGLTSSHTGTPYRIVEAAGSGPVWWPRVILLGLRDPARHHPDAVRILKGYLAGDVLRGGDTLLFGEGEGSLLYVEAEPAGPDRFEIRVTDDDRVRTVPVSSGHPVLHLFHMLQELRMNVVFAGAPGLDTRLAAIRPAAREEARTRETPDPALLQDYIGAIEQRIYRHVLPRLFAHIDDPVPRTLVAVLGEDEVLHGGVQETLASVHVPYAVVLAAPVPETPGVGREGSEAAEN